MKKHHNAHRITERRKKTRAEITHMNKQKPAVVTQAQNDPMPTWNDLHTIHASCRDLLGVVRPTSQIFTNKELIEAMGDNVIKLRDLASTLNADVQEYVKALNSINDEHKDKHGEITDPTELAQMLVIGEKYQQWTASYESVVVSTIEDIFALANSFLPDDKKIPKPQ